MPWPLRPSSASRPVRDREKSTSGRQQVGGGSAECLSRRGAGVEIRGAASLAAAKRLDVDEEVGQEVGVQLDLLELHLGIVDPLGAKQLEKQCSQFLVLGLNVVGFDDVPDGIDAGEHLLVGPLEPGWRAVDAGVDVCAPPALHRDPERLAVGDQPLVELVHRAAASRRGPGDRRQEVVPGGAVLYELLDVLRFLIDGGVEPRDRIAQGLTCPLHLVDGIAGRRVLVDGVSTSIGLTHRVAGDVWEEVGKECPAQLLEPFVSQPLVEVPAR